MTCFLFELFHGDRFGTAFMAMILHIPQSTLAIFGCGASRFRVDDETCIQQGSPFPGYSELRTCIAAFLSAIGGDGGGGNCALGLLNMGTSGLWSVMMSNSGPPYKYRWNLSHAQAIARPSRSICEYRRSTEFLSR